MPPERNTRSIVEVPELFVSGLLHESDWPTLLGSTAFSRATLSKTIWLSEGVIRISGNFWTGVSLYLGHGSISGTSYGADEAGAQPTAQSERIKARSTANRFHAVSQASMMSARLINTELASQWLRR
jgi:hypothetical protein